MSRGITLEYVASVTRISMRFLEAIEAGEFRKLPGGVFAINYVRQYARCVGLDEGPLIERCRRSLQPEPEVHELASVIDAVAPARARQPKRFFPRIPVIRVRIVWTSSARRRNPSALDPTLPAA